MLPCSRWAGLYVKPIPTDVSGKSGVTQCCSAAQGRGSRKAEEKVQIFQLFVLEAALISSHTRFHGNLDAIVTILVVKSQVGS